MPSHMHSTKEKDQFNLTSDNVVAVGRSEKSEAERQAFWNSVNVPRRSEGYDLGFVAKFCFNKIKGHFPSYGETLENEDGQDYFLCVNRSLR